MPISEVALIWRKHSNQTVSIMAVLRGSGGMVVDKDVAASLIPELAPKLGGG